MLQTGVSAYPPDENILKLTEIAIVKLDIEAKIVPILDSIHIVFYQVDAHLISLLAHFHKEIH